MGGWVGLQQQTWCTPRLLLAGGTPREVLPKLVQFFVRKPAQGNWHPSIRAEDGPDALQNNDNITSPFRLSKGTPVGRVTYLPFVLTRLANSIKYWRASGLLSAS